MNDLELLQRFRAETPEPDERWIRELRARILIDDQLPKQPARPRPKRVFLLVAAVLGAAIFLVFGSSVLPGDAPAGPDPAVADVLLRFSRVAVRAPAEEPPRPGQYVYWASTQVSTRLFFPGPGLEPFAYQVSGVHERWLGLDGSGRSLHREGQPVFLSDEDRQAYESFLGTPASRSWGGAEGFGWGVSTDDRYGTGELWSGQDPSDLPTDPEALRADLERQEAKGGSNGDWGVFTHAVDQLTAGYMPPEIRAAFYEAMSTIPGTELIGPVRDDLGRRGISIGHTRDGIREEVIFHRRTGDILAIRTIRVDDDPNAGSEVGQNPCCGEFAWAGTEAGTVMFETIFVIDGAVVESIHDRPSTS